MSRYCHCLLLAKGHYDLSSSRINDNSIFILSSQGRWSTSTLGTGVTAHFRLDTLKENEPDKANVNMTWVDKFSC